MTLLAILGLAFPSVQDVYEGKSAHYRIRSTADRPTARELLKYMDLCFGAYRRFLNPDPEKLPREPLLLVLYRDRAEYTGSGGTGRFGHFDGKQLAGFADPEQMRPTFAHEGVHQFVEMCIPKPDRLPPWYAEGIAECIANNEVRSGKLYLCTADGPVPRLRVPVVQAAIRDSTVIPLRRLLRAGNREFQKRHELYYAQSWLFCHFLLTYPKREDPSKQIPEGKYKPVIVTFHNAMLDPKRKAREALDAALRSDGGKIELEPLEREFLEYARTFELPKRDR